MNQQAESLPVEALFKASAAVSPDITYLLDEKKNIIHANQASENLLGFPEDEILETQIFSLIHPDDTHGVGSDLQSHSPDFSPPVRKIRLRHKDNSYLNVALRVFQVPSEQGNFSGMLLRELNNRRRQNPSDEQQKNAILHSQLDTSWDGILVVDPDNKIILTNDRFHRMWSIAPHIAELQDDEIQIRTVLDQLVDPDAFLARVQYLNEHPEDTSLELIPLKDGRSFERYSAPLHDIDNTFLGRIWYFRDITQTKNMEEEMLKLKKLESVSVLAGGIAHDFNNILTAVLGNIQLSTFHLDQDNKALPLLQEAKKAGMRAQTLTSQLLALSKKNMPVKQATMLDAIVEESCAFLSKSSNVRCRLTMAGKLWPVDCDREQISQVIQNLIYNARQAMPNGGTIDISTENIYHTGNSKLVPGDYVYMTICDQGCGIPAKDIDRIFDPYFTTKSLNADQGTGLGLAVVHSIINKHGGLIEVESREGKGTTFSILLPAGKQDNR
ncbi:MAG TPA: PAS domain-containing sensor histidine kinase [Desulfobacterales bacterium]|nr:PAS domain-containing sensor histidine kinase [Desulfobacterales bacterium]HIP38105.1 PAS domain-containing sensor histidine kinase [Desulfocapsa sulfexigens]